MSTLIVDVAATIPAGDATGQSSVVNITGNLVGLIIPAAWTAAALTFLASFDGITFFPVYDGATERNYTLPTGAAYLSLSLNDWLGVNFLKLRSGTSAAPVAQAADRTFQLLLAS